MAGISDLLYSLTEWLRTTPINDFALWISAKPMSQAIGSKFLTIPLLQTTHIIAIATAFAAVLMMNLKVLGVVGADQTIAQTSRRYTPWVWGALLVLIATGLALITAEPVRELVNSLFWIKMTMVVALVLLSIGFQSLLRRNAIGGVVPADGLNVAKLGAVGLILLWCAVIIAGRWIAYAPS